MAIDKIHRGDDKLVVVPLATGLTHSDYLDVECTLVDSYNKVKGRFSKNIDKGTGWSQIIIEADEGAVLAIGIPIDTDVTLPLKDGIYYLLVRFVFDDNSFPDDDRRQSDSQPAFQIVPDSQPTSVSSTIYYYGINGAILGDGAVLRQEGNLSVATNNIEIDFNSRNEFIALNRVAVSTPTTISFVNATIARIVTFKVALTNFATAPITFPSGSISGDSRIISGIFTAEANGNYTISIYITGSEYEVTISQNPAV